MQSADTLLHATGFGLDRLFRRTAARARAMRRVALAAVLLAAAGCLHASAQTPNAQFNQKAVDLGARGDLRINPVTSALELQIPLGNYPGRAGLNLPVTISYSSKLWRVDYVNYDPGHFNSNGNPLNDGYTRVVARYAERSSAGWTTNLAFPVFDTMPTQYFDMYGATKPTANDCGTVGCYVVDRSIIWMPDGSSHELRSTDQPKSMYDGTPFPDDLYAVDGSRIRFNRPTQTLFMPDGGRYLLLTRQYVDRNGNALTYEAANNRWVDTLGRGIGLPPLATAAGTYNYALPGVGGASINYTFVWKNLGDAGVLTTAQQLQYVADNGCPVGNGSFSPRLFQSDPIGTRTCITNASSIFNPVVLSQIQLPTGQSYTFTYNVYGEIDRVQLPTGGYERYEHTQFPTVGAMGVPYTQANRGVTNRFVSAGGGAPESPWHYEGTGLVKTFPPDNTLVELSVHTDSGPSWGYAQDGARSGHVYAERVYSAPDAGGTRHMLRRTLTEWATTGSNASGLFGVDKASRNPRMTKRVEILLDTPGAALTRTTTYGYDLTYQFSTGVNQTSVGEYDYVAVDQNTAQTAAVGSFAVPPVPLRVTETQYLDGNAAYRDRNVLGLPNSATVKDGAGTILAQTTMSYDESTYQLGNTYGAVTGWAAPTGPRGNATTVSRWLDRPNSYVQAHAQYDQCGSVVGSWDGNGNKTQIAYSSAFAFAYPTTVTTPAPNPVAEYGYPAGTFGSTAGLATQTSYDPFTGLVLSVTDANLKSTTYDYGDPLNRVKRVDTPGGGRTTYTYVDTHQCGAYVESRTLLDSSGRETDSYKFFDGLGRPYLAQTYDGQDASKAWLRSDVRFDSSGRVSQVSSPYRSSGCTATPNPSGRWTTTAYDDLGRVKSLTTPDGATTDTTYSVNVTTATDPHAAGTTGRMRRGVSDAFGRLVRLDEPDASTGALDDAGGNPVQPTYYAYDPLGNLRKITQGGQTRFFMYDSLSRLIRAKNPEQGSFTSDTDFPALTDSSNSQWSTGFKYDAGGKLVKIKHARDVVANYTYDHLNRNIITAYTLPAGGVPATPEVRRSYDNPAAGVNGIGRPFWVHAVGVSATVSDSYDAAGRPTQQHQSYWVNNAWGQPFVVSRGYDLTGNVASVTYPSGHAVGYGYDAAGRLGDNGALPAFAGNLGDGAQRTYSSQVRYYEMGGVEQERFGADTPVYNKSLYNSRGQLAEIRVSVYPITSAGHETDWDRGAIINHYSAAAGAWGATGGGPDNNGNLKKQDIYIPDGTGGYSASTFFYDYDYLNRLKQAREGFGSSNLWVQAYDYDRFGNRTINAALTTGSAPEPQFSVDASTNRLGVPSGQSGAIGYDASGNLTNDTYQGGTGGGGTRTYDAENRMTAAQFVSGQMQTATYTYDGNGHRIKRNTGAGGEVWQVYGVGGELLAEYAAGGAPTQPAKEYGYRAGELLVTAEPGTGGAQSGATVTNQFVTGMTLGANRADSPGWTGMRINVGAQPVTVSSLGRLCNSGNSLSHDLKIVRASDNATVATATVAMSGCTASQFKYAQLGSPVTLAANTNYYVVSYEVGGDLFRDWTGTWLTTTSVASVTAAVYTPDGGQTWGTPTGAGNSYVPVGFEYTTPAPQPLVTGMTLGASRADSPGWTGTKITVGPQALTVTNIGRLCNSGNSLSHDLKIVRASDNVTVATATVSMSGCTVNQFKYAQLATPVTLAANTGYYVVSYEVGGDLFRDWTGTWLTPTSAAAFSGAVYTTNGGQTWSVPTGAGNSYVPVDIKYMPVGAPAEVRWLVNDQLGTPRMVVDQTGSLAGVKRHDYLPFGEEAVGDAAWRTTGRGYGANDGVRQKLTGKERDSETGLDHFGARAYSNIQGRFLGVDPLRASARLFNPQTLNRYSYVLNRPTIAVDPDGLSTIVVTVKPAASGQLGPTASVELINKKGTTQGHVYDGLARGTGRDRMKERGDTPFGVYKAHPDPTTGGTFDSRQMGEPYGTGKVSFEGVSGEIIASHRTLIRIHGGGSGLPDSFALTQELINTWGCVRLYNMDVNDLVQHIDSLADSGDPLDRVFIGDAEYLKNLAEQRDSNNEYLYPDLRLGLGLYDTGEAMQSLVDADQRRRELALRMLELQAERQKAEKVRRHSRNR